MKPSERVSQIISENKWTNDTNFQLLALFHYLDEQHAKKSEECKHTWTGINQMQKESYCTKCGVKKQSMRR